MTLAGRGLWSLSLGSPIAAAALALGLAVSLSLPAQAASGFSVQISPLPIELTANPGQTVTSDLRVRNAGTSDEHLEIHLFTVTQDSNGGVHLSQPGPSDAFVQWVHFSQTTFDAPPNVWQDIKMTVAVPTSAAFGYYFAVEYTPATPAPLEPGHTVSNGAVATFVLLDVNAPGAQRLAKLVSVTADHRWYEFLPATITVKVHAGGNIQVAPHGNVFIMHGTKTLDTLQLNEAASDILPGASRSFSAVWSDGFPHYAPKLVGGQPAVTKQGQPEHTLVWDWSQLSTLRLGHYTAKVILVYDNGQADVPLEGSVSFWVIPWRLIGGVTVVIILVGIGAVNSLKSAWRLLRRARRR